MQGNLSESKTIPSVSYVSRYFSDLPNDARFSNVSWKRCGPTEGITKSSVAINFILPKMDAPFVYLVNLIAAIT